MESCNTFKGTVQHKLSNYTPAFFKQHNMFGGITKGLGVI